MAHESDAGSARKFKKGPGVLQAKLRQAHSENTETTQPVENFFLLVEQKNNKERRNKLALVSEGHLPVLFVDNAVKISSSEDPTSRWRTYREAELSLLPNRITRSTTTRNPPQI